METGGRADAEPGTEAFKGRQGDDLKALKHAVIDRATSARTIKSDKW
jgi:hypothetical protein